MARHHRFRRPLCVLLLLIVIGLGLGSRRYPDRLPWLVREFAGDTLWALAAFLGVLVIWPTLSRWKAAGLALSISWLVEFSQLYHAPWLDAIRSTRLGGLVLGFGFLGSDLLCYTVGVALGVLTDIALSRFARSSVPDHARS